MTAYRFRTKLVYSIVAVVSVAVVSAPAHSGDRLVFLDGTIESRQIMSIDKEGFVRIAESDAPIALSALRRIERSRTSTESTAKKTIVVELVGGGQINCERLTIKDEVCHIRWRFTDDLQLPIDVVRAIRLKPNAQNADFESALKVDSGDFDQLFTKLGDRFEVIKGLVEELDDTKCVFEWKGDTKSLDRSKLFGVVVAFSGRAASKSGLCLVRLADGSSLWGQIDSLANVKLSTATAAKTDATKDSKADNRSIGELKFRASGQAEGDAIDIPWESVLSVTIQSKRLVYVSDLKPTEVVEQTVYALARPWQRDRSVGGRQLTVGGRVFEKGIGVQAKSSLTFQMGASFELFAATIGLDAEVENRGDCEFVVLGDGKELFRKRQKSTDAPSDIRVNISGIKLVTLVVEPGEELIDLGDHADWCDAVFIRTK